MKVQFTKTPVVLKYPLTYERNFHGRLYEKVIRKESGCNADRDNEGTTCGWAMNATSGRPIAESQGFCCGCEKETLLGGEKLLFRSNTKCPAFDFTFWNKPRGAAHCYTFDPDHEHLGFTIGDQHTMSFSIYVDVQVFARDANGTQGPRLEYKSASVRPDKPIDTSRPQIKVELLGDFANYVSPPQVHNKWLFVPWREELRKENLTETAIHRISLTSRQWEWMIVDRDMVTETGECDKIGVDYFGFRNNQANRCDVPEGSCLKNQIVPLRDRDIERVTRGQSPQYLLGRYGSSTFPSGSLGSNCVGCTGVNPTEDIAKPINWDLPRDPLKNLWLQLPVRETQTSVLLVTLDTDDIVYTQTRSPARILKLEVCSFDGKKCGGFESMTTSGFLNVEVENTGFVAADYAVTVTNCSENVLPVAPQQWGIQPKGSQQFQFKLEMGSLRAENNTCDVTVWDSQGLVATARSVAFTTTAPKIEKPPVQSNGTDGELVDPEDPTKGVVMKKATPEFCQQACPNIVNLKCLIDNGCYGRMAKGIAAIAAPVALLGGLFAAWKTGYLSIAIRVLLAFFSFLFCRARTQPAPEPAKQSAASSGKKGGKAARDPSQDDEEGGSGAGKQAKPAQAGMDGSVGMTYKSGKFGKGAPAYDNEPQGAGLLRQRSGSLNRQASIMSAAHQAKGTLLGMNQVLITNPLAVGPEARVGAAPVHMAQPTVLPASTLPAGVASSGQPSAVTQQQQQMIMMQQQLERTRQQRMQISGAHG